MLLLLLAALTAPTCTTSDRRVEELISTKMRELGGIEYCQYRMYESMADIDGDSVADFLVVFTVEAPAGGNNSTQFLAAFASGSNWAPSVVQVAQRGQRIVEGVKADGRTIVLQTLEYGKGDAMCCPSIESEARFQIQGGKIVASSPSRPTKR
jgi:hypothetical protein